jgi:hypothetical protein
MRFRSVAFAWFMALIPAALSAQALDFEARVRAQEALERVHYEHRLWPAENPGPKPPFGEVFTRAQEETPKVYEFRITHNWGAAVSPWRGEASRPTAGRRGPRSPARSRCSSRAGSSSMPPDGDGGHIVFHFSAYNSLDKVVIASRAGCICRDGGVG